MLELLTNNNKSTTVNIKFKDSTYTETMSRFGIIGQLISLSELKILWF